MGKMKENPRYAVISARVTDAELDQIKQMAAREKLPISEVIRRRMLA